MRRVFCNHCGHIQNYYSIKPIRCEFCMEKSMKKIVIDPGHGGDDNGAAWGYTEEDDINLIVSFLLRCELEKSGHEVIITRENDHAVPLNMRTHLANEAQADLFVSIHCDAFHNTTASGMSVYVHPECSFATLETAENIKRMLELRFPNHRNRGIKKSYFHVLRHTKMPAVLVECEFLSNPETRKFLREPENQLGLARAISRGIV